MVSVSSTIAGPFLKENIAILMHFQGRIQGGGVQGVQLNPPSKLMIFMTIVMPLKNKGRNVRTV